MSAWHRLQFHPSASRQPSAVAGLMSTSPVCCLPYSSAVYLTRLSYFYPSAFYPTLRLPQFYPSTVRPIHLSIDIGRTTVLDAQFFYCNIHMIYRIVYLYFVYPKVCRPPHPPVVTASVYRQPVCLPPCVIFTELTGRNSATSACVRTLTGAGHGLAPSPPARTFQIREYARVLTDRADRMTTGWCSLSFESTDI